ncbi:unnamed protein product [Acanthosepion pharaonis]|uniref:Uncharacterized protein n=1 Tax=Acanthosepion pharaonis TaxID=158019 RepID=A0A812E4T4_ACAPH|nr:unnamed protein product [Sepia pharaonis]
MSVSVALYLSHIFCFLVFASFSLSDHLISRYPSIYGFFLSGVQPLSICLYLSLLNLSLCVCVSTFVRHHHPVTIDIPPCVSDCLTLYRSLFFCSPSSASFNQSLFLSSKSLCLSVSLPSYSSLYFLCLSVFISSSLSLSLFLSLSLSLFLSLSLRASVVPFLPGFQPLSIAHSLYFLNLYACLYLFNRIPLYIFCLSVFISSYISLSLFLSLSLRASVFPFLPGFQPLSIAHSLYLLNLYACLYLFHRIPLYIFCVSLSLLVRISLSLSLSLSLCLAVHLHLPLLNSLVLPVPQFLPLTLPTNLSLTAYISKLSPPFCLLARLVLSPCPPPIFC